MTLTLTLTLNLTLTLTLSLPMTQLHLPATLQLLAQDVLQPAAVARTTVYEVPDRRRGLKQQIAEKDAKKAVKVAETRQEAAAIEQSLKARASHAIALTLMSTGFAWQGLSATAVQRELSCTLFKGSACAQLLCADTLPRSVSSAMSSDMIMFIALHVTAILLPVMTERQ